MDRHEQERALAQLRHAYSHLAAEAVVRQREFADELLAPIIATLEAALSDRPPPLAQRSPPTGRAATARSR